jgi:hypothetical protein
VRAAFPDSRLTVKDTFDYPSILLMAGFLGLKGVRRESVETARTTLQTRDFTVFLRNTALSSNSLEAASSPSHEQLAIEDMKWIRFSFTDVPIEMNGVNRQSLTKAILRMWKHLMPVTGERDAVLWSSIDGVVESGAHPSGALSVAIVDDSGRVSSLLLSLLRFDAHSAEGFVNDFMIEVARSNGSVRLSHRLPTESSRTHSTSSPSGRHLPVNCQTVAFWRDVAESAAVANIVTAKVLLTRNVVSRDAIGIARQVAVRLPQLLGKESDTVIASWLVTSVLLHSASELPDDKHHQGTAGITMSIVAELPDNTGSMNQVPLSVEASPKLVV